MAYQAVLRKLPSGVISEHLEDVLTATVLGAISYAPPAVARSFLLETARVPAGSAEVTFAFWPSHRLDSGDNSEPDVFVTLGRADGAVLIIDEHVLDFGPEDVAIVHGGTKASFDRGRLRDYAEALTSRGLPIRPEFITAGALTFVGGRAAVVALLALPRRPSAILATNNLMTVGALAAIADAGLEVSDDLSIVGISDMEWFPIARPAITAVCQPSEELGRRAAERLLLRLRRKRQPKAERIRLDIELRVRDSVGRASRRGLVAAESGTASRNGGASDG